MDSTTGSEEPQPATRGKFHVKGALWRRALDWSGENIPFFLEPIFLAFWSLVFYFVAREGRHAVVSNLRLIFPKSPQWLLKLRALRVFWNYAWTLSDVTRVRAGNAQCDWELEGIERFNEVCAEPGGIIIMTAHMGSYDLGAQVFSDKIKRNIVMVRAPEPDAETQKYVEKRGWTSDAPVSVGNSQEGMLSVDLLAAVRRGDALAIQGDRCPTGLASLKGELFGAPVQVPSGPFVLSLAAGVPVIPLFVIRLGRRRYLLRAGEPIRCVKTGRDREKDLLPGVNAWCKTLEETGRLYWRQWYSFEKIR